MFSKRAGTSGIRGQLYRTKLLSLLYFRAIHDETVGKFQLASKVDNIGVFDDICFKANVEGFGNVVVFIQAQHRENEKQTLKNNLATCFDSYLKIRKRFQSNIEDMLFRGRFNEANCLFVIYTTARTDICSASDTHAFSSKLTDLIDTCDGKTDGVRGAIMLPQKQEENVAFLCKIAMKVHVTSLAVLIANYIHDDDNSQAMLSNEIMKIYHVVLAQKVLEISEIQPDGQRIASFRNDFFATTEEYITLFKDTLYREILERRTVELTDINSSLSDLLADPADVTNLSKLIGTVVIYNNGMLQLVKKYSEYFNKQLDEVYVIRLAVNEAVEIAAKKILSSCRFKVPAAFGNKDLTITGSVEDVDTVLNDLSSIIIDLVNSYKSSDNVIIDESLEEGFLQLDRGIASTIGNIFVLDDDTKWMKITDNCETLGTLAKTLYTKLNGAIHNLHEYKFSFNVDKLPKLKFDCSDYEESLARDFFKKLLFYSKQADEKEVETSLKKEIEDYQRDHSNYFQVKTDAIFLKYHDEILKWWMSPGQASYLTRESDTFNKAISNIIEGPLMSSIKVTYMSKIHHFEYSFREDVASSWSLQDHSSTVIITENSVLTVVKVLQHLKNKEHVTVLDLEYIVKLPTNDRNALRTELTNTSEDNYLIFVCDILLNLRKEKKILESIAQALHKKHTVIVTNNLALALVKEYFPKVDNTVHDDKISLIHLSDESQKIILSNARLIFQGKNVRLQSIMDDKTKAFVKGDILNTIISDEPIAVGKLIFNRNYDEMKHLYIDRRIKRTTDGNSKVVKTLDDLPDKLVLITAEPGMGKSTLLTHLTLKTKELKPEVWIVRINLLDYSKEFSKMKEEKTVIDTLETLKFMCQVILREKHGGNDNNVEFELEEDNGIVNLVKCSGDLWTEFELKLFLHFYEEGKLIFLFDGFDELCPHYTNEVLACLKTVRDSRKHKTWITSRSYHEVKTILQREFGASYEIDNFSHTEMQKYLKTFWENNLRSEELNSAQVENVKNFMEYMSKLEDVMLHGFAVQLYSVYVSAAQYLLSEIKCRRPPSWTYNVNDDDKIYSQVKDYDYVSSFHKDDGNPLHLLLAAVFVESNIKTVSKDKDRWNLEVNSFTFYERFLEKKIKTIRFQDKNEMNIYYPDILITYDKELANFISKHKKLAAYGVFKEYSDKLFNEKDLEEINATIRFIENGGEKTGLIYTVVNDVPTFVLSEHFAVEYLCDGLKSEHVDKQTWIECIFNEIFSTESYMGILNIFDTKLKTDESLRNLLEKNDREIFDVLMRQGRVYCEHVARTYEARPIGTSCGRRHWPLADALSQQLHNFTVFFVKLLRRHIDDSNLSDFLDIVRGSQLLMSACTYNSEVLLICVLDVIRQIDETRLVSVLLDNLTFVPQSAISNCVQMSSQEIAERILTYEDSLVDRQIASGSTSSGFSSGSTSSLPSQPSSSNVPTQLAMSSLPRRSPTPSLSS